MTDGLPLSRRALLKSGALGSPLAIGGSSVLPKLASEDDKESVTGRAVDVFGQPLADVRVTLYAPEVVSRDAGETGIEKNVEFTTVGTTISDEEGVFELDADLGAGTETYLEQPFAQRNWKDPSKLKGFVLVADYPDEMAEALGSATGDLEWFGALEVDGDNLFQPDEPHEIVLDRKKLFGPDRMAAADDGTTPEGVVSVWKKVHRDDPCVQHVGIEVEGIDGKLEGKREQRGPPRGVWAQAIGPGLLSLQVPESAHVSYASDANRARKGRTRYLPTSYLQDPPLAPLPSFRGELAATGQDVPLHAALTRKYVALDEQRKEQILQDLQTENYVEGLIDTTVNLAIGVIGLLSGGTGAIAATLLTTAQSVWFDDQSDPDPHVPSPDDAERFFGNPDAAPSPNLNEGDLVTADWPLLSKEDVDVLPMAMTNWTRLRFESQAEVTFGARGLWIVDERPDGESWLLRLDHGFEVDPSDVTPLETATSPESALDSMVADSRVAGTGKRPRSDPLSGPQSTVTESEVVVPEPRFDQPRSSAPADPGGSEEPLAPSGDGALGMATAAMPLRNGESVEEFVQFEDGAPTTSTDLAESRTSLLFFWLDARGLSLAVLHGEGADGGTGELTFEGLPPEGEWVLAGGDGGVEKNGDEWTVTFGSGPSRAAAFRGLDLGCGTVTVTPERWDGIDDWVVLDATGDGADAPDRHHVDKGTPVTFRIAANSGATTDVLDDVGPEDRYFRDDFSSGYETAWTVLRRQGDFSVARKTSSASVPNPDLALFGEDGWSPEGDALVRLTETTGGGTSGTVGWRTPRYGWHTPWVARGLFYTAEVPLDVGSQWHSLTLGEGVYVSLGFTADSGGPRPFFVRPPGAEDPPTYDPGWTRDTWYHYEVTHDGLGGYQGRLWADGDGRPSEPSVSVDGDPLGADPRRSSINLNGAKDTPFHVDHAFQAWNSQPPGGDDA